MAMPNNCCVNSTVIASAAKQSRGHSTRPLDCFVARAPRNDGQWWCSRSPSRLSYFWASPEYDSYTARRSSSDKMPANGLDWRRRVARSDRSAKSATTWLAGDARICAHSAKAGEALPFASCQRRTFSRALSSKAGAARTFSATS